MEIPKIIHYCWFGGNPLTDKAKKCIESWKKYCKNYEIKEWNESNFDFNNCAYAKEAYEQKKWAFVSDYARFWILYNEGGLYFDVDVELIKNIDDIVEKGPFLGREKILKNSKNKLEPIAPGLGCGAVPKMKFYKDMLEMYEKEHFILEDASINKKNIVTYTTDYFLKYGYINTNEIKKINDINIYPSEYFCPMNYYDGTIKVTDKTKSIHWYDASWFSESSKKITKIERKINKLLPNPLNKLVCIIYRKTYRLIEYAKKGIIIEKIREKMGNKNEKR